jgi:hypothetical protein
MLSGLSAIGCSHCRCCIFPYWFLHIKPAVAMACRQAAQCDSERMVPWDVANNSSLTRSSSFCLRPLMHRLVLCAQCSARSHIVPDATGQCALPQWPQHTMRHARRSFHTAATTTCTMHTNQLPLFTSLKPNLSRDPHLSNNSI